MTDLSTYFKGDEVAEFNILIENLKDQLINAHADIDTLNLTNETLKRKLLEEKQISTQYKNNFIISISTKNKRLSYSSKDKKIFYRANHSARKLNFDIAFQSPKTLPCDQPNNNNVGCDKLDNSDYIYKELFGINSL